MDESDKVCHLYMTMSDKYEMTVSALRTLLEKNQKLPMVKNKLLEEETKRMTKRSIMKPKVNIDTATASTSHRNDQRSN
jgi:hypothetical protein